MLIIYFQLGNFIDCITAQFANNNSPTKGGNPNYYNNTHTQYFPQSPNIGSLQNVTQSPTTPTPPQYRYFVNGYFIIFCTVYSLRHLHSPHHPHITCIPKSTPNHLHSHITCTLHINPHHLLLPNHLDAPYHLQHHLSAQQLQQLCVTHIILRSLSPSTDKPNSISELLKLLGHHFLHSHNIKR